MGRKDRELVSWIGPGFPTMICRQSTKRLQAASCKAISCASNVFAQHDALHVNLDDIIKNDDVESSSDVPLCIDTNLRRPRVSSTRTQTYLV